MPEYNPDQVPIAETPSGETVMRDLSTKEGMRTFLKGAAERALELRALKFTTHDSLRRALKDQQEFAILTPEEQERVERMLVGAISEISLHRVREAQAANPRSEVWASGRISKGNPDQLQTTHTPRSEYSGKDLASGAEVEDRRDEIEKDRLVS